MKKFSVLRYIRQFSALIFVFALVGALGIYRYGSSNQKYTATTLIQYTNSSVKNGYTPNGKKLDVSEIYSSAVVDAALKELGDTASIDTIRSGCYVDEIVPEEEQIRKEALLEKGEEYEYVSDTYRVSFVADSSGDKDYARDILDAVIKNYFEFYTERYVEEQVPENGASSLQMKQFDLIEAVEILEKSIADMMGYLAEQQEKRPNFRSVETGYSYGDLYDIYQYLFNNEIPDLYAVILNSAETDDRDTLANRFQKEIEEVDLAIRNAEKQAGELKKLIDEYSARNQEMMQYHYHNEETSDNTEYVLKDVDYNEGEGDKKTTYDKLLLEYEELLVFVGEQEIRKEHYTYLKEAFSAASAAAKTGQMSKEEIRTQIDQCVSRLNEYYQLVNLTGQELNRHLSADYLTTISSIRVTESINLTVYIAVAVVLFLVIGCIGAILLGRGLDFVDYLLYVDRLVDLPNRARCDTFIAEKSEALLPDNYACAVINFDALNDLSRRFGRKTGDAIMKEFAQIIKAFGELYGFVGHNGGGMFLAFFENCPSSRLKTIMAALDRQVQEYNHGHAGREIVYSKGLAVSTDDNAYEIRQLLRIAMRNRNAAGPAQPGNTGRK